MQIPVLVEPLSNGRGFHARAGEPFSISVESSERASAIDEVKQKLESLMAAGHVVSVDVGVSNAATRLIGTIDMNNPEAQKWWQYVEEFREQCETLTFPGESVE